MNESAQVYAGFPPLCQAIHICCIFQQRSTRANDLPLVPYAFSLKMFGLKKSCWFAFQYPVPFQVASYQDITKWGMNTMSTKNSKAEHLPCEGRG